MSIAAAVALWLLRSPDPAPSHECADATLPSRGPTADGVAAGAVRGVTDAGRSDDLAVSAPTPEGADSVNGSPPFEPDDEEYFPRDPDEWQGMRVLRDERQAFCVGSTTCGMAMACLSDGCGPCRTDGDCAEGERCAVQHCVVAALAECTSRHDCAAGELCMLTGYTAAPRGNENMRAECVADHGGVESEDAIGRFERGVYVLGAVDEARALADQLRSERLARDRGLAAPERGEPDAF